jgi:GntR family transcriptional regulator, transcriptional repressor for pyruvate dehydrogenase complex
MAVTDEAIEKLRAMIVSGKLRPGDRLPREADLATTLGLSRNSLREAVRALSLVRILDVRQGDGTYVSSLAADSLLEALSFIVEFHHDASVLELLEVRRILEPAASARAAVLIGEPSIEHLAEILGRANADSPVEDLVTADVEFHRAIAAVAGNTVLASLIESLSAPTQRARVWRGMTQEGALQRTLDEHQAIFDAISRRDPEMARTWATVHVAGVEEWLRSALAE